MKRHFCGLFCIFIFSHLATAHDGGPEGANFGPDKGVTAVSEKDGFKLSAEATKTFKLTFEVVKPTQGGVLLDAASFVFTGEDVSVYRLREGWLKRVDVKILKKGTPQSLVVSKDLGTGDQVITRGVNWVRVAELDGLGDEAEHTDEHDEPASEHSDQHEEKHHD